MERRTIAYGVVRTFSRVLYLPFSPVDRNPIKFLLLEVYRG
jgi:hypothetical protein